MVELKSIRLPLNIEDYKREYQHIVKLADVNGYRKSLIDRLVQQHSHKLKRDGATTLIAQNITSTQSSERRVALTFVPNITHKLQHTFKQCNTRIVHTNTNELRSMLGSTKDSIPMCKKSGVYKITCPKCGHNYIGQTCRAVECRITEHDRYTQKKDVNKAVAAHAFDLNNDEPHLMKPIHLNYKLIKTVRLTSKLDAYESALMAITDNLMNIDTSPIEKTR